MKKFVFVLIPIIAVIIGAGIFVVVNATPGDSLTLADYFEVTYTGYNTCGGVDITRKDDMMFDEVDAIRIEQKDALIKNKNAKNEDYMLFAAGIEAITNAPETLKNGDQVTVEYLYDEELAKELRIAVDAEPTVYTVEGLTDAEPISVEQLFQDISVTFEGVSPNVVMTVKNNSTNPLISTLVFNPVEYKETYSAGDVVTIKCFYNENQMLHENYYIDAPADECVKEYVVEGTDEYVNDLNDIPSDIIRKAIDTGKTAFIDANEYGVRIFCEANLVPVYIDKKATFRYLTPRTLSAYFKVVNEDAAGKDGNHYNDLDIVYEVDITQADGVTCSCEAVVRFSNFVKKADGTIEYDFSNPKIISASYQNSAIVKNVVTRYEGTYDIEKLDLSKY